MQGQLVCHGKPAGLPALHIPPASPSPTPSSYPQLLQALDARTPATMAGGQPGGLSRVAAALATTVQRPQRQGRYSFAGAGATTGLLDLDGCAGWQEVGEAHG